MQELQQQQISNPYKERANPEEIIFKLKAMINILQENENGRDEQPNTLQIETQELNKLREEAEALEISVAELIRRKLSNPATEKEILELRRLREFFRRRK